MQLAIEIEVESTWPEEFLAEARKHRSLVIAYHRESQRIDRQAQDDILMRVYPPVNRYRCDYRALASRLDNELTPHRLVGYHCTCLTPREIASIKTAGMRPLSAELIREKFEGAVSDGYLTPDKAAWLLRHEYQVAALGNQHGKRTGMTWFCANRSTLTKASGVYFLFRYWGGEATRGGPAGHPLILREIVHIGAPCIVKCAIPVTDARQHYDNYAEHFLSRIIADEFKHPEPSVAFNFNVKVGVASTNVLGVIEYSDPEFEELTNSSSWSDRESISPHRDKLCETAEQATAAPSTDAHSALDISDAELIEIIEWLDREV